MGRRLAAALAGALMLAGCSAEANPPNKNATSPSPPASTPNPTPPEVAAPKAPEEINRPDAEGAAAVAEHFLSLIPYMYTTGDLEAWLAISEPDCNYCSSIASDVKSLHENGGFLLDTAIDVSVLDARESEPGTGVFRVRAEVSESDYTKYESGDAEPLKEAGGDYTLQVIVLRHSDSWTVRGVEVEQR